MNRRQRKGLLGGLMVFSLLWGCTPTTETAVKPLRVGMDPAIGRPFVYEATEKTYGGFEVELSQYIADKLERPLEIQAHRWNELPTLVQRKKIDLALSAIEKPEKAPAPDKLAFTPAYYTAYQKLSVHNSDNFTYNLSDLNNKKVGVVLNSVGALLLTELNKIKKAGIKIQTFPTPEAVFEALSKKEITAALTERAVASWYAWKHKNVKLTGDAITTPLPYVGLLNQESEALKKDIEAVFKAARQDPEFQAIFDKWHVSIKK